MANKGIEKIANILRVDKKVILEIEEKLGAASGKRWVMDYIMEENEELIDSALLALGVKRDSYAKEVYDGLISKVEADDYQVFKALGSPDYKKIENYQKIADSALKAINPPKGFFLKVDKAKEFLVKSPPQKVMSFLGYDSVEKMIQNENIFELMSSLRFIEGGDWLNSVFFKQYDGLTIDDFEERDIKVIVLDPKWLGKAEGFIRKKWHNISHLKEMGIVFVIPLVLGISGEVLRMIALIMHYLNEIPFYSEIFKKIGADEENFAKNFQSLLRGDVINKHFHNDKTMHWLVVQRYLAKGDEHDWRLFYPHINPEAIHWMKAEEKMADLEKILGIKDKRLEFWKGVGWVGDFFKDEVGIDILVSFDLVDTVMSLVKEKEMIKYLYHHQEALWNKIFMAYFGREKLEQFSKEYLLKGYFEI